MIDKTSHRVPTPFLPESLRGFQVAHLTDLHRSRLTSDRLLHHAMRLANSSHADLILLTGDYVTEDREDILPVSQMLGSLRAQYGVYAVLGNHDHYTDGPAMERALVHAGITVLSNQAVRLPNGLWIVGIEDDRHGYPDIQRSFALVPENEPVLVMVHNPANAEKFTHRACVAFSGHTHGGQVRIPIITDREIRKIGAKHYRAGWYPVGRVQLYVNRGLGRVGYPIRFLCKPELAMFTLLPDRAQPARASVENKGEDC